jgi:hypothetical protein
VPFIRAVILNALLELSADVTIANLLYLSTRDIVRYLKFSAVEEVTIKGFLNNIADIIGDAAHEKFRIRHALNNTLINTEGVKRTIIDEVATKKVLEGDSGDGTLPTFIPKVVKSYSASINKAHLDTMNHLELVSGSINALGLKTELIWWKTTAYSILLKKPYSAVSSPLLEIALAADYATFVPYIFPESVDYFLSATYVEVTGKDEEISLSAFLNSLADEPGVIAHILTDKALPDGRISLLDFITGLVHKKFLLADLKKKVGIEPELKLTPGSLVIWLFHDLQSRKILSLN